MFAILFICTPTGSFANEYTWPPRENAPVLTLLGPVYETGLELESKLTKILALSLKKLAESPECCLPESYIDALGGIQYLRFVTGYKTMRSGVPLKPSPCKKMVPLTRSGLRGYWKITQIGNQAWNWLCACVTKPVTSVLQLWKVTA